MTKRKLKSENSKRRNLWPCSPVTKIEKNKKAEEKRKSCRKYQTEI